MGWRWRRRRRGWLGRDSNLEHLHSDRLHQHACRLGLQLFAAPEEFDEYLPVLLQDCRAVMEKRHKLVGACCRAAGARQLVAALDAWAAGFHDHLRASRHLGGAAAQALCRLRPAVEVRRGVDCLAWRRGWSGRGAAQSHFHGREPFRLARRLSGCTGFWDQGVDILASKIIKK